MRRPCMVCNFNIPSSYGLRDLQPLLISWTLWPIFRGLTRLTANETVILLPCLIYFPFLLASLAVDLVNLLKLSSSISILSHNCCSSDSWDDPHFLPLPIMIMITITINWYILQKILVIGVLTNSKASKPSARCSQLQYNFYINRCYTCGAL